MFVWIIDLQSIPWNYLVTSYVNQRRAALNEQVTLYII